MLVYFPDTPTILQPGSSQTGIIAGAVILAVIVVVGIIVLVVCKWVFYYFVYRVLPSIDI